MTEVTHAVVGLDGDGQRIDNYLLKLLKGVPRTRIYRLLRRGEVRVDGKRVPPLFRLQTGQTLRIPPVTTATRVMVRPPRAMVESLERRILAEETDFLVLDKPAGTAVHSGSGVTVGVIEALAAGRTGFLELVHRLDRDTSGLLLLAKSPQALRSLQTEFRQRSIGKRYRVVVLGNWTMGDQLVEFALTRFLTPNGERRVRVDSQGQTASSRFRIHQSGQQVSTLIVELLTGRTHQIRVHAAALGHPVVHDNKYGASEGWQQAVNEAAGRLLLHAHELEFEHAGRLWQFEAPVPPLFDEIQRRFG